MVNSNKIIVRPVVISHEDGRQETVYISEPEQKTSMLGNLMTVYFIVGTVALVLSATFTYMQLKKSKITTR